MKGKYHSTQGVHSDKGRGSQWRWGGRQVAGDSISMISLLLVAIGISPDKEPSPLLSRLINTDSKKKKARTRSIWNVRWRAYILMVAAIKLNCKRWLLWRCSHDREFLTGPDSSCKNGSVHISHWIAMGYLWVLESGLWVLQLAGEKF